MHEEKEEKRKRCVIGRKKKRLAGERIRNRKENGEKSVNAQ